MKDKGIPWIGSIPEAWDIFITTENTEKHRGECGYEEHKPKLCVLCELCGKIFGDPRCTERNGTTKGQPSCNFEFLSREIYLNCFPFALFASWRETSYPFIFSRLSRAAGLPVTSGSTPFLRALRDLRGENPEPCASVRNQILNTEFSFHYEIR